MKVSRNTKTISLAILGSNLICVSLFARTNDFTDFSAAQLKAQKQADLRVFAYDTPLLVPEAILGL